MQTLVSGYLTPIPPLLWILWPLRGQGEASSSGFVRRVPVCCSRSLPQELEPAFAALELQGHLHREHWLSILNCLCHSWGPRISGENPNKRLVLRCECWGGKKGVRVLSAWINNSRLLKWPEDRLLGAWMWPLDGHLNPHLSAWVLCLHPTGALFRLESQSKGGRICCGVGRDS